MIRIQSLVWDSWNRNHINEHAVSPSEIIQVFEGQFRVRESYRKRLLIKGKTYNGRQLFVVLTPEDKNQNPYPEGVYYVITAFEPNDKEGGQK